MKSTHTGWIAWTARIAPPPTISDQTLPPKPTIRSHHRDHTGSRKIPPKTLKRCANNGVTKAPVLEVPPAREETVLLLRSIKRTTKAPPACDTTSPAPPLPPPPPPPLTPTPGPAVEVDGACGRWSSYSTMERTAFCQQYRHVRASCLRRFLRSGTSLYKRLHPCTHATYG